MNRTILATIPFAVALTLTGCGAENVATTPGAGPPANELMNPAQAPADSSTQTAKSHSISFFGGATAHQTKLTLAPDQFVRSHMPSVPPPTQQVNVYLPVYPGSVKARPLPAIGDMGTPLDGDLVDAAVYYKSSASAAAIAAWYQTQFKKIGYVENGSGSSADHGRQTSYYVSYNKAGHPPGAPVQSPDIDLGFLAQSNGDQTVFKLKALYIVTPPRPKDSLLPPDIERVQLTEGKETKTLTNKGWIDSVVRMVNSLRVSTPGITSSGRALCADGRAVVSKSNQGTTSANSGAPMVPACGPTLIHAEFFQADGTAIPATFNLTFFVATVNHSGVTLVGTVPQLWQMLGSQFPPG